MERLRRGAEGGAEGPGAASGLGHTQNEATDLTAELAFTTIKAGRWSDSAIFGPVLVPPVVTRFEGSNAVASSPARLARPEGNSP